MTEPCTDINISELVARPAAAISAREIEGLQAGLLTTTRILEEVAFYEQAVLWGRTDARAAHAAVLARDVPDREPTFPELRLATLAWLAQMIQRSEGAPPDVRDLMREVEEEQKANRVADKAREAAFRRDPGRWLKDATPFAVPMLRAEGCWIADRDGEVVLCTHASSVCGRDAQQAVEAAYTRALKDEYRTVIIIGAPGLGDRIQLPDALERDLMEIEFVVVEIDAADVTGPSPTGGRAA
ncbi:hypothetical protein [Methylobacterium sp. AMS5]|uniref:hypothetical protein n=1 Tax=Methylobacterium sp. AMS5 TaxID=925818 RepID=UPI00074F8AFC|nr:hypothetical protein [Methylobacterium sp. AMS5]AMB45057.1 hypothetical protein Y590_09125 [Methylobacterium sp. AMS5]